MVYVKNNLMFDKRQLFLETKKGVPVEELLLHVKANIFFIAAQTNSSSYSCCKSKNKKS